MLINISINIFQNILRRTIYFQFIFFTLIAFTLIKPTSVSAAFPTVETTSTSAETGTVTSHTVNLPTGIAAGNLVIVIFGYAAPAATVTWPDASWHQFFVEENINGGTEGFAGAWHEGTGSEGPTITVTTDLAQRSAHTSYRISGAIDPDTQPPEALDGQGNNGNPDPPSLTPTGGAKDYLWLAVGSSSHDDTYTAYPTNYTNGISASTATAAAGHSITGSAQRQLNASSEDPVAFTHNQSTVAEWVAATIAVHPSAAATPHTNNNFSLSAWVYPSSSIATKAIVVKNSEIRLVTDASGNPLCQISNSASWQTAATSSVALSLNSWQHVGCTYDQVTLKVFVNGVLTGSQSLTATVDNTTNKWRFGDDEGGTYGDYQGKMDDVRMYNYTRTTTQIIEDMNAGHPAPGSPVGSATGYWKLDEGYGTTAYDQSTNANNLTLSTASWTNSGKFGKAFNGTGSDPHLSRADDADFDFGSNVDFTLSAWFKSDSATNPSNNEYLIDKESASAGYALWATATNAYITCGIDNDGTSFPSDSATASNDYYDQAWHHAVCTRNTTLNRLDLYIDGVLINSDTSVTTADLSNADSLTIGAQDTTAGGTDDFTGDIDEVKIYRFALTSSEVKVEYNWASNAVLGTSGTTAGGTGDWSAERSYCPPGDSTASCSPVGEWKLDENTGTAVNDTSGNGNNVTATNDPVWTPCKIGPCLEFDGSNDYANNTSISSALNITGNLTISAWVYRDTTSSDDAIVIEDGDASGEGDNKNYVFYINDTDSTLKLEWEYGAIQTLETTTSTASLTNASGSWVHIAATRDTTANEVIFYENGAKLGNTVSFTNDPTGGGNTPNLTIGARNNTPIDPFDGKIDTVRVFNYEMTPVQIAWDYNRSAPVAWYKLDECQGTTANNSAPAASGGDPGLDGTINARSLGNTAAGTCSGSSTDMWFDGATGKFNASIGFDGSDDDFSVTNASGIDLNEGLQNGLTISAWVYANSDGEADVGKIFTKGAETFCQTDSQSGSNLDIQCELDLSTDATLNISSAITTAAWNHIAVSWSDDGDDEITIWINGKNRGSSTDGVGPTSADTNNLIIGNDSTQANTFDGLIDDFRIFNYEMSSVQIRTLYTESSAVRFGPGTGSP